MKKVTLLWLLAVGFAGGQPCLVCKNGQFLELGSPTACASASSSPDCIVPAGCMGIEKGGDCSCDTIGDPAAEEVCNGIDDDCNGEVDEGWPRQVSCGVGACVATGQETCVDGILQSDCAPAPPSSDELCNGIDDDCDGQTDEGWPREVSCGVGFCAATGQETCVDGVLSNDCAPGNPTDEEVCNGIDDDCDGEIDEGWPRQVSCGVGACATTGQETCINGVLSNDCTPGTPSDEICNGIDDDCDGETDEGLENESITCGVGECIESGTSTCVDGVPNVECTPGTPLPEGCVADGLDNDCDGVVDNGTGSGGTELCDGIDNDCDGEIDGKDCVCFTTGTPQGCIRSFSPVSSCPALCGIVPFSQNILNDNYCFCGKETSFGSNVCWGSKPPQAALDMGLPDPRFGSCSQPCTFTSDCSDPRNEGASAYTRARFDVICVRDTSTECGSSPGLKQVSNQYGRGYCFFPCNNYERLSPS